MISAQLLEAKVTTHKGRRVITTTKFGGFQLNFNEALSTASIQNTSAYQLTQTVMKGRRRINKPVPFNLTYNAATNSVDLAVLGKTPLFAKGGQLTLTASAITDTSGDKLTGPAVFTILAHARGIIG